MRSLLAVGSFAVASAVTPTQKVVQMLGGMAEKGKEEKHAEQVQFAAYKQFCDDTSAEKRTSIDDANESLEKLNADMNKAKSDAAELGKEIAHHESEIARFEGDIKAATSVRELERGDYQGTHADYSESVDALGRAIATLKEQNFDRKQTEAFLQAVMPIVPVEKQHIITAFLATDPEVSLAQQAPEAHGYEFQSGGVIEMLENLKEKFIDERSELQKAEMNAKHAYEMLMQDMRASIDHNTEGKDAKSAMKGKKLAAAAQAKGDIADTTQTRDDDQKYLTDLVATCQQKASDFKNRQQLRADEIAAIEKAKEILSSGAVAGAAATHLPSLVQTSFMQLKSTRNNDVTDERKEVVASFLARSANKLGSRVLAQLAEQAGADPFKKVKKLIQDLVVRLMEEANQEAEHHGWCQTELKTNEQTRKEKSSKVEALTAEIDSLQASIKKMGEQIKELNAAVTDLSKAVAEATNLRQTEKKKNAATLKDAEEAQTAVAQALVVLKEFYAKAGEATSLLQQQPEAPEVFDEPYKGMQSENGGVVGMIEVIQSDFARLAAETTSAEAEATREYDEFMSDSAVDKAQKSKDIEHKTAKKQDQQQTLQEKKSDLEGTGKELKAAQEYFDKLKPDCINTGVSYEDRVAKRKEEVESLQEALRILNGEDSA